LSKASPATHPEILVSHPRDRLTVGRPLLVRRPSCGVLRRHGSSRLACSGRSAPAVIATVRERPGELLHLDMKKLGHIPDGGVYGDVRRRHEDVTGVRLISTPLWTTAPRLACRSLPRRERGEDRRRLSARDAAVVLAGMGCRRAGDADCAYAYVHALPLTLAEIEARHRPADHSQWQKWRDSIARWSRSGLRQCLHVDHPAQCLQR